MRHSRRSTDDAEETQRRNKSFEEEAKAERLAALEEAANFEGCYPALALTMLQLLPSKACFCYTTCIVLQEALLLERCFM